MIKFILLVNKQGQTRLAQYYEDKTTTEKELLEGELVRRCLSRTEFQCNLIEFLHYKIIYRRYASLYFIVALDNDDVVSTQKWYSLQLLACYLFSL
jgi:AP-4 complex subunit sigma-1